MKLRAVGLISPGDMGHVVGQVLIGHGLPVLTCLEGRSERTRSLAHDAGITVVPTYEELVRDADILLSIVVPAKAVELARRASQALRNTGAHLIYVDCNSISPATVRQVGRIVTEAGGRFVDAGIIGPPPRKKGSTRFYVSGADAGEFEALSAYGLDVRVLGTEIGQASGFKIAYAAMTKGFAALATELLVAAQRMGLYDALVEEFRLSQAPRYAFMEELLPSMPTKSRRWVGEMEEIAATFAALGLTPKIHQGAADIYRFVGGTALADETPETMDKNRTLAQMIKIMAEELAAAQK